MNRVLTSFQDLWRAIRYGSCGPSISSGSILDLNFTEITHKNLELFAGDASFSEETIGRFEIAMDKAVCM